MKETYSLKGLRKHLNSLQTYLLKIQIEREHFNSSVQRLITYSVPIFLSIFNSSYIFQAKIFENTDLSVIFQIFLYLTPDQLSIYSGLPNYFIILSYIIILLPILLTSIQIYHLKSSKRASYWVTFSINLIFPATFRLLMMPMMTILLWSVRVTLFPSLSRPGQESTSLGGFSLMFVVLLTFETGVFLLFFSVNSYQFREKHVFACSNLIGEVNLISNSCLMALVNVVLVDKEVWQNFIRMILHAIMVHTLVMKQPYYSFKTNVLLAASYSYSFIVSFGFLIAYNIGSSTIVVLLMIFFCPAALFLVYTFAKHQRKKITVSALKEINFEWQIDFINLYFVEQFEAEKKTKNSADLDDFISETCLKIEKFYEEKLKIQAESLIVSSSLFFIYLDRPERAYYNIFFHHLSDSNFLCSTQMKKIELIVLESRILEHFYSEYFVLTSQCKKNDLKVCRTLLRLCTELHKNYPNLEKIKFKLKSLMKYFDKSLKIYSQLMKDYQSQENLELYGSFLLNILNDVKGNKYLTLARNMSNDRYDDSKIFWLLDKDTGYCVFSSSRTDYGRIIEFNQQFVDILHINKETISENLLDLIFGPFQKTAHDLFLQKLEKMTDFEVLRECFRCFVDFEDFFIDIDLYLIPINWKDEKCLLLTIRPLSEILIVIEKNFKILNVSRNFVSKVLGSNNKSSVPLLLNKKISYFLPDFENKYLKDSKFSYHLFGSPGKMDITAKTFKYKHLDYIFLTVRNFSRAVFRQSSLMETIKRKHSLTIVQISDSNYYSKNKIAEKASNLSMKDSTIESKKYDYEPESFSLTKRAKKDNKEILNVFNTRKACIKLILVVIYLVSVVSMTGSLVYIVFYVHSFRDSVIIGKYSEILSTIQDITTEARMLNLVQLGMLPSFKPTFQGFLNQSINDLDDLLEEVHSNEFITRNGLLDEKSIDLLVFQNGSLKHQKTSLELAIRLYISRAKSFYNAESWDSDDFLFLYANGHASLIENFSKSLHSICKTFISSKESAESYMFLIMILPQVFLAVLLFTALFSQLRRVGKSYKDILREITGLKKEKLLKISECVVKRLKIYHHEVREVKNVDRNRKPEIKKKWKTSALLFLAVLTGYCLVVNLCLTFPSSQLNEHLAVYTGESLMTINFYVRLSYFWSIEEFLLNYPKYSYDSIMPGNLLRGDLKSRVYKTNERIRKILKEFRTEMEDKQSRSYLLNSACDSNCSTFPKGGLNSDINELLAVHEFLLQINRIIHFSDSVTHYQLLTSLTSKIKSFQKLCRDYTANVLVQWNYLGIGIILNLLFGLSLIVVYQVHLQASLQSIVTFITFRIFYKSSEQSSRS